MDARELLIGAFTHPSFSGLDTHGLALAFAVWLDITRPDIAIAGGRFTVRCDSPRAAERVSEQWGGTASGLFVKGHVVDLTS